MQIDSKACAASLLVLLLCNGLVVHRLCRGRLTVADQVFKAKADMPCPAGRAAPVLLLAVERRVCFTIEDLAPAAPAFDHLLARLRENLEGPARPPRPSAAAAPLAERHAHVDPSGAAAAPDRDYPAHSMQPSRQLSAAHALHAGLQAAGEAAGGGAGEADERHATWPEACSGAPAGAGPQPVSCRAALGSCSEARAGGASGGGAAPGACIGGWRHLRGTRLEVGGVPRVLDYERGGDLELWQLHWGELLDVIAV